MDMGLFVWKMLVTPLDLFVFALLASWVTGRLEGAAFAVREKGQLLLGVGAFLLQGGALLARSDGLSVCVTFVYVFLSICLKTKSGRLRAFGKTLVLLLLFISPLNTAFFLLQACGVAAYAGGEGDVLLWGAGAVLDGLIVAFIWRVRRYRSAVLLRFGKGEVALIALIFLLTVLLGASLDPAAGVLSEEALRAPSARFFLGVIAGTVALVNALFLLMIWKNKAAAYYQYLNREQQRYIENELRYFEVYKSAQTDLRAFRHDMKHHISHLQRLCGEGDMAQVRGYVRQMQENWEHAADSLYHTGDDTVDSILNAKAWLMKKEHIQLVLSGAFAGNLPVSPFDLCAIFSNALDNAAEETRGVQGERYVSVSIGRTDYYYIVSIENPLRAEGGEREEKKDRRDHGFGLSSIREKAERNGGAVRIQKGGGRFLLEVFLPVARFTAQK